MEVILIKDVDNLGDSNTLVKVRDGYGRNYLIPRVLVVDILNSAFFETAVFLAHHP